VWSADPGADTRGGLSAGFKQYNAVFGTTSVAQATGNGFLYSLAPSVTPTLLGSTSRAYDGSTSVSLVAANYGVSGAVDGDTVVLTSPAPAPWIPKTRAAAKP
jgi:hypothetical protein